jgi:two-component system sensor kinase
MPSKPSREALLAEIADLRGRLEEAEETLRAIRRGEVDALVISGPEGDRVFTLKGADHTYRLLVETINEGAATLTADGKFIYANRRLAEMLKLPLEQVITAGIGDYIDPPDRELFEALFSKGKQGASSGEVHLRAADGSPVPAYLSLSSMQIEALPDLVCLAATDLTEQKRQEDIVAAGRLFRAILEQAEHAIVVCDAHGIITQASRAAHRLFSGNPLLRRFEEVFPLRLKIQENGEPFSTEKAFFLAPVLRGEVYRDAEASFRCLSGHDFHLLLDAGPITGENGEVLGCVVILTDITARQQQELERQRLLEEQRSLTEELTATNEELATQAEELAVQKEELEKLNAALRSKQQLLEAANEEMESFSYSVSHDLKTPVRAIQGFSRMLMGEHADRLDAEGLRLLKVIVTNTQLMYHLIDDLLALSRLGRMQVKKSVVNLNAMSRQIFDRLQAEAPDRDLQLKVGSMPPALGDQSLLYQVVQNLLANAIKFTKQRKPAVIEVGGKEEEKETVYYVKDNGIGFDERYAGNLFRPFQRLHGGENYEGSGVGLAIVKRIIQRHGGRVWAAGKINEGAVFYFTLPKMRPEQDRHEF